MHPQVAVVGGGIGGLATALSLFGAGFDVHVFEQARALREVGAGIQVSPNASRVLHGLGLGDPLAKLGVRPFAIQFRSWDDGRTVAKTPLGDTVIKAFGFPHYQSHRADVLAMLIDALPAERLHVGHRLVAVTDCGDRVEAAFENGERITTDALIGADGIHSTVRELLFGPANPHFTGCVAYRGLIPDAGRAAMCCRRQTAQMSIHFRYVCTSVYPSRNGMIVHAFGKGPSLLIRHRAV